MQANKVVVGRLGASFGVQGWQRLQSFTMPPANIFKYQPWSMGENSVRCLAFKPHKDGFIVQMQGIDSPEAASKLTNNTLLVDRECFESLAENEFYWSDLQGLSVYNLSQEKVGVLDHLYENAELQVMVIKNDNSEWHVPFIMHDTVVAVDLTKQSLVLDWKL